MNRSKKTHFNKLCLGFLFSLAPFTSGFAQAPGQPAAPQFSDRLQRIVQKAGDGEKRDEGIKFDLDFPGGGPKQLVEAIEKAGAGSLNVIVAPEHESVLLPSMKLKNVTVAAVFEALASASQRIVTYGGGTWTSSYAFKTEGKGENPIWYFRPQLPPEPQKFCRFYQLADFLETYKIEDITTAIRTGWELIGVKSAPELKFHPETKLLIAVGTTDELQTIESVLQELRKAVAPRNIPGMYPGMPPAIGTPAPGPGIPVRPAHTPASPTKKDGAPPGK